jgi:hypothetical protein
MKKLEIKFLRNFPRNNLEQILKHVNYTFDPQDYPAVCYY